MADKDIKVLLVEDHTMIRMGTALVIEKTDGITLCAQAEDGQQGVDMAREFLPDVILMDIGLPVIDGIEATRRIKDMGLNSKILIFTSRDCDDDVFAALAAGADGYIMKGATPDELKAAGLEGHYTEHGLALFPVDSNGIPWTAAYISTTGDPIADLEEDLAAEQKARAVYENLINQTNDPDILGPLLWLRQREIVHYNRFKELSDEYKAKGYM